MAVALAVVIQVAFINSKLFKLETNSKWTKACLYFEKQIWIPFLAKVGQIVEAVSRWPHFSEVEALAICDPHW